MSHTERTTVQSVEAFLKANRISGEQNPPSSSQKAIPVEIIPQSSDKTTESEVYRTFGIRVGERLDFTLNIDDDSTELVWPASEAPSPHLLHQLIEHDIPKSLHLSEKIDESHSRVGWIFRENGTVNSFNLSEREDYSEFWSHQMNPDYDYIHGGITGTTVIGHEDGMLWKFGIHNADEGTQMSLAMTTVNPEHAVDLWNNLTLQHAIKTHKDKALLPQGFAIESRFAERLRSHINLIAQQPLTT